MNFTSLRYFAVVAEELNISHAAEKLFISQQSLSGHINRLEEELNVRLFERSPRLTLTYAGSCLLRISHQILDLEKQIHVQLDDISSERAGSLAIGLTRVRARTLLPQILPTYSKLYPRVEVHTIITDNQTLQEKLLKGELDLIICNNPPSCESTSNILLLRDRFCVIAPLALMRSRYPDTWEAAVLAYQNGHPFTAGFFRDVPVLLSVGTHVRMATDRFFQQIGTRPSALMETNDMETLFSLCERGMGITFSYENYAQKILPLERNYTGPNDGALIFPVNDEALCGQIEISYRSDRYLSRAAKQFIEIAHSEVTEKAVNPAVPPFK